MHPFLWVELYPLRHRGAGYDIIIKRTMNCTVTIPARDGHEATTVEQLIRTTHGIVRSLPYVKHKRDNILHHRLDVTIDGSNFQLTVDIDKVTRKVTHVCLLTADPSIAEPGPDDWVPCIYSIDVIQFQERPVMFEAYNYRSGYNNITSLQSIMDPNY